MINFIHMKKSLLFLLIAIGINYFANAQVSITGIVNRYYQVTAFTASSGGTCSSPATLASVTLGAAFGAATPATLTAGMEVLIIQMQAGSTGVIDRTLTSSTYGDVSNTGGAGNYEFATIATVAGSTVTFTKQLVNTYNVAGKVQLIPTWLGNTSSTIYATTGTIVPLLYSEVNGVGGVVVISTSGTITLNNDINADVMGFQGGDTIGNPYNTSWPWNYIQYACCGSFVSGGGLAMDATNGPKYAFPLVLSQARDNTASPCSNTALTIIKGARKGRGIFGVFTGEEISRGKVANGGGGGHGFNSGGAGGGGYSGGGNGGYELAWACNGSVTQPAGLDNGGRGGLGMLGGTTALFMGGGGGGGHGDGNSETIVPATTGGYAAGDFRGPTSGGDGGGIVFIKSSQVIASGTRTISARGGSGGYANQDGAGGGGGGGSIIMEVPAYSGTISLDASGGTGGHAINPNSSDCHGTGGGGGGGRIVLSLGSAPAGVTVNTNGGGAGRLLQFNCGAGSCNGGDEYLQDKTSSFCGANIFWGSGVGTSTVPTYSTNINTQTCGPLPVTLLNFSALLEENNNAEIFWNTGSEMNTSYFVIERSYDGINFEMAGSVLSHNNSQSTAYYSFMDKNVSTHSGIIYYRLKIVDLNNEYSYSTIVGIVLKGTILSVYPNPVKGEENIKVNYYSYLENEIVKSELIDIIGRPLYSLYSNVHKGSNELSISTKGFGAGVYFVEVNGKYGKIVEKIIIE
jgi:hypothetical protein